MALRRATLNEIRVGSLPRLMETQIYTGMGTLTDEQVRSRCAVMALEPTPSASDCLELPLINSNCLEPTPSASDCLRLPLSRSSSRWSSYGRRRQGQVDMPPMVLGRGAVVSTCMQGQVDMPPMVLTF